jgi:hypothetical protein
MSRIAGNNLKAGGRHGRDPALVTWEGARLWQHLDVRLPASRTLREHNLCYFNPPNVFHLLQQSLEINTTPNKGLQFACHLTMVEAS